MRFSGRGRPLAAAMVLVAAFAASTAPAVASPSTRAATATVAPGASAAPAAPATSSLSAPSALATSAAPTTSPTPATTPGLGTLGADPATSSSDPSDPSGPPPPPTRMINDDAPDPTVVASGSTLYAYTTSISLFGTWYNTPEWSSSDDGATWALQGDALPSPGSWTEGQGWVWAPGVVQLGDGSWNLYYAARLLGSTANPMYAGAGMQCLGVATASTPTGPFTNRPSLYGTIECQWDRGGTVDPKPVYADDGGLRLLFKSEDNAAFIGGNPRLWSARLTADGLGVASVPQSLLTRDQAWEVPAIENPSMVKAGGRWWMTYSGGRWDSSSYAIGLATCAGPDGPCTKTSATPWMSSGPGIAGPGGSDFFRTADGDLYVVYAGWDPAAVGYGVGGVRSGFAQRVAVGPSSLMYGSPFGDLDPVVDSTVAGTTAGSLTASGWALDPDTDDPIDVDVYVDGVLVMSTPASTALSGAALVDADHGQAHGFSVTTPVPSGKHTVCVYGTNVDAGSDAAIGCDAVTVVAGRPFGAVVSATGSAASVEVTGTAADPDTPTAPIDVQVTVDGSVAATVSASAASPDFALAHPGFGATHGFDATVNAPAGSHQVCAIGVNVGQDANTSLGCRTVLVTGPLTSYAPAVASNADGRLEVFTTTSTGQLIHKWQIVPNGPWSGWTTLSGATLAGPPTITTNADGRLEAFGVTADRTVVHMWQVRPNGDWSGVLGEPGMSVPDRRVELVRNADGRLEMFARAADASIDHKWQVVPNGTWSGWTSFGGNLASSPAVTTGLGGRLEMFVQGSNRELLTTHQTVAGSAWVPWTSLGGTIDGPPAVVHDALGRLSIFASAGSGVAGISEATIGVSWGEWMSLAGDLRAGANLAAAPDLDGAMQVFGTDATGSLMVIGQVDDSSGPWASSWTPLVGGARDGTTVATNEDGRLEVFFTTAGGAVGHSWETAPNGTWTGLALV